MVLLDFNKSKSLNKLTKKTKETFKFKFYIYYENVIY